MSHNHPALFIENQEAALSVLIQNPIPHHQGIPRTFVVTEANALTRGESRTLVRRAESALAGIEQTAHQLDRAAAFQGQPDLASGRVAPLPSLFRNAYLHSHTTEVSCASLVP